MSNLPHLTRRQFMAGTAGLAAALPFASWAKSSWPNGAVKIIVPFGAGGNTDTIARLMAERLTDKLATPFVVENRAGAGGQIASEFVARSKPDAQTLYMTTMSQIVMQPLVNKVRYDPVKDFDPLVNVGGNAFVLAVNPRRGFKTLADMVDYGKANPGKLNVAHAGVGAITHLSALMFLNRAGVEATMVPYKGGSAALLDVVTGQCDIYSASPSEIIQYAETGEVTLLGISSPERLGKLPNVPTISETYPGYVVETWNGMVGPAGMPEDAQNQLADAGKAIIADPDFQKKLRDIGIDPYGETRQDFAKRISTEIAAWTPIIKEAGIES